MHHAACTRACGGVWGNWPGTARLVRRHVIEPGKPPLLVRTHIPEGVPDNPEPEVLDDLVEHLLKQLGGVAAVQPALNLPHLGFLYGGHHGTKGHGGTAPASAGDSADPLVDTAGDIGLSLYRA